MTTPTKTVVNVQTGEVVIVELSGAELEAYNASVAAQQVVEQVPVETPAEVPAEQA